MSRMTIALICLAAALTAMCFAPPPAAAEPAPTPHYVGWGPRVGLTMNPDQVHFGLHLDLGRLASQVHLRPSLELGVGDNVSLIALDIDVLYRFNTTTGGSWVPYAGGAMGVNRMSVDRRGLEDDTDTDVGLNALLGLERPLSARNSFLTEARIGLTDSPDFKLTVGWTFR